MILVDTTPLVALCDERDQFHARAIADLDRLSAKRLVVCTSVLTEACFHLSSAHYRTRLVELITDLSIDPPDGEAELELWLDVFGWLQRYAEHEPDLADGFLVVLSARHRKSKVWTYDGEFSNIWRRPDGSRVPLAVTSGK